MLSEAFFHNLSLMNHSIVILEYTLAIREEKKSIDGEIWSFSIQVVDWRNYLGT